MKKRIALAVACLLLSVGIGGVVYGLFTTRTAEACNIFTIGSVKIRLTEPNYDPMGNTPMVQGQIIPKDPIITNTGSNPAWVWMEVDVPTETVWTVAADGSLAGEETVELFRMNMQDTTDWILLEKRSSDADITTYVYGYAKKLPANDRERETTAPLFTDVTYQNILEDNQKSRTYHIDVRAYGIQTTLPGLEETDRLTAEQFTKILEEYRETAAE